MRYLTSRTLYWLGDLAWRVSEHLGADREEPPAPFRMAFWVYQRMMLWARLVQGSGPGPWQPVTDASPGTSPAE